MSERTAPYRILIVDDNRSIHEDFKRALGQDHTRAAAMALVELEQTLFGDSPAATTDALPLYELAFAEQGDEAMQQVRASQAAGRPFALAFLDIRMPPGPDGVETMKQLWNLDPSLQIEIFTAYSDYSPQQIREASAGHETLDVVRKPFDRDEIQRIAMKLTTVWEAARAPRRTQSEAA